MECVRHSFPDSEGSFVQAAVQNPQNIQFIHKDCISYDLRFTDSKNKSSLRCDRLIFTINTVWPVKESGLAFGMIGSLKFCLDATGCCFCLFPKKQVWMNKPKDTIKFKFHRKQVPPPHFSEKSVLYSKNVKVLVYYSALGHSIYPVYLRLIWKRCQISHLRLDAWLICHYKTLWQSPAQCFVLPHQVVSDRTE